MFMSLPYKIFIYPMILLTTLIFACQPIVYENGEFVADPESRIKLIGGDPQPGSLKNQDLHMEYQYIYQPETIQFTGSINLAGRLSGNFEIVRFFFLTVNFLDEEGLLLSRERIFYAGRGDLIDVTWRFDKQLITPTGAVSFAFSYIGEVREAEEDSFIGFTGVEPFELNPLQRVPAP
jgi:hypothetical protein